MKSPDSTSEPVPGDGPTCVILTERAAYPSDPSDARWARFIVTDTAELLLAVMVTAASASDNTIGVQLLDQATTAHPALTKTSVDAGFRTGVIEHAATLGVDVEVVTKDPQVTGFSVVKRRWVVERTLGWIMQHRRLARDDEALPATSATMIRIAMIDNLTRRATDDHPNLATHLTT